MLILFLKLFNSQTNRLCYLPVQHLGDPWGVVHGRASQAFVKLKCNPASYHKKLFPVRSVLKQLETNSKWWPRNRMNDISAKHVHQVTYPVFTGIVCIYMRNHANSLLHNISSAFMICCRNSGVCYLSACFGVTSLQFECTIETTTNTTYRLSYLQQTVHTPSPSFAVETPSRYPPSMAMEFDNCSERYARSNEVAGRRQESKARFDGYVALEALMFFSDSASNHCLRLRIGLMKNNETTFRFVDMPWHAMTGIGLP